MNLFTLADGRRTFYQWDVDRQLIVHDTTCTEVHFFNGSDDSCPVCKVKDQDGLRVVDVPDTLLQDTRSITAFAFVDEDDGGYTRRAVVFPVRARPKPDDYVYTEPEKQTWEQVTERMEALEKDLDNQVAAEVQAYVSENPDAVSGLPKITEESEGKYLRVKDGAAVWGDLEIPQQYGLVTYDQTRTITIT